MEITNVQDVTCTQGDTGSYVCQTYVNVDVGVSNESTQDYDLDVSVSGGTLSTALDGGIQEQLPGPTEQIQAVGESDTCEPGPTEVNVWASLRSDFELTDQDVISIDVICEP